jgi:hypothetical protein
LTLAIIILKFKSPLGLQLPKWKLPWKCEGSFLHTFLHSQASFLAYNLASLCLGREPKARVATHAMGSIIVNMHNINLIIFAKTTIKVDKDILEKKKLH